MKKLLLISIISIVIGCSPDPINIEQLNRGRSRSTYFSKETNKPYTGPVFFRDSSGKTFLQGSLKDGEKMGTWVFFTEQGRKFEGVFKVLPPPMYTGCIFDYFYYGDSIVVGYQNFELGISNGPQKYINVEEGILNVKEVNHSFSQRDGKYNYYNSIGDKEEATYVKGLREGWFTSYNHKFQSTAKGFYINDKYHGKVTTSFLNGTKVESQYVNGIKEGLTYSYNSNGDTIEKYTYVNGELNGAYTHSTNEGQIEEGVYVNGKREGKFKFFSKVGVLEGTFINDQIHGEYTLHTFEGSVEEGVYVYGNKEGKFIYQHSNGCVTEGTHINDQKHGEYSLYIPKVGVEKGNLVSGLKEGPFILYHSDGAVTKGINKNDKYEGWLTQYNIDGSEFQSFWVNGLLIK